MEKGLIIVGIDPGTTVGYAILDINGNLLKIDSSKDFSLSKLISRTIYHGKVIAVGTDKKRVPSFIEEFAVKTGSRIISPKEDISVRLKNSILKENSGNEHERDALACACLAYKELKPLLNKVDKFAKKYRKKGLRNKLKELVVRNNNLSISSAFSIIEQPNQA